MTNFLGHGVLAPIPTAASAGAPVCASSASSVWRNRGYLGSRGISRISARFVSQLLALCLGPSIHLFAEDAVYGGGRPPSAEAAYAAIAPTIDGVWAAGEWNQAQPIAFPTAPGGGGTAEAAPCEARFLWNASGLFVAFRTNDAHPVYGDFKPGEPLYLEDVFELFIDQGGDHRQYFEIQIDPGAQLYIKSYVLTAAPRLTPDQRLTPEFVERELWRYDVPKPEGIIAASKMDPQTHRWCMEAFLPASLVNRRRGGYPMVPCKWRMNLVRHDWDLPVAVPNRKGAFLYWAAVLPGHPHLSPEAMGWLELRGP